MPSELYKVPNKWLGKYYDLEVFMSRKPKDSVFGTDVLLKVQSSWRAYQEKTNCSQAAAAHSIMMNQSAFSQYLRGCIGLNIDFLLRFSKLVGKKPEFFSSSLRDFDTIANSRGFKGVSVNVVGTLTSTTEPYTQTVLAGNEVEARKVTCPIGNIPVDTILLLAKEGSPISEGDICVVMDGDESFIGAIKEVDGVWSVIIAGLGVTTVKKISNTATVQRLEASILPVSKTAKKYC